MTDASAMTENATAIATSATRSALLSDAAISVRGLHKSYGSVRALCGVDLDVAAGTVLPAAMTSVTSDRNAIAPP